MKNCSLLNICWFHFLLFCYMIFMFQILIIILNNCCFLNQSKNHSFFLFFPVNLVILAFIYQKHSMILFNLKYFYFLIQLLILSSFDTSQQRIDQLTLLFLVLEIYILAVKFVNWTYQLEKVFWINCPRFCQPWRIFISSSIHLGFFLSASYFLL